MPISLSCPSCGKAMVVDDHYAGQSGPCAGCGRPLTIPSPAGAPGTERGSGAIGVLGVVLGVGVVGLVLCVGVAGLLYAVMAPAVWQVKSAAARSQSTSNMKQLVLALHNYHATYESLPPAYVADASGKPLYSWRVLILPFLSEQALYDKFDTTKAWDDPANITVSNSMVAAFRSPRDPNVASDGTNYFCMIGPNTAFPAAASRNFTQITDGLSNTIVLLELKDVAGSWAAPIDPSIDKIQPVVGDGTNQLHPVEPEGIIVALGDGSVRYLKREAAASAVQPATLNVNDGIMLPIE